MSYPTIEEDSDYKTVIDELPTDFVLAYQINDQSESQIEYRRLFEHKLRQAGLFLRPTKTETSNSTDNSTRFVRISAPPSVLARQATLSNTFIQIPRTDIIERNENLLKFQTTSQQYVRKFCCGKNPFGNDDPFKPNERPLHFVMEFNNFKNIQHDEQLQNYFTNIQRIRLVNELITQTLISGAEIQGQLLPVHWKEDLVGLNFLTQNGVYVDAFPLHDGSVFAQDKNANQKFKNNVFLRPCLHEAWASYTRLFKYQPLNQIREYFGEQIGMFFAWLGFYTYYLIPLTILGLLMILWPLIMMITGDWSAMDDIKILCQDNRTLCRWCANDICDYEHLKDTCTDAYMNYTIANYATLIYAIGLSLWAILFLKHWKRYQSRLACKWGMINVHNEYDPTRPEYQAASRQTKLHPVTQRHEPHIPTRRKNINLCKSISAVSFFICILLAVICAIIIYKICGVFLFAKIKSNLIRKVGDSNVVTATASILHTICILTFEKIYSRLAWILTENEFPRTQSDFETSYTHKMYIFQFINYYIALFYLALVQGHMFTTPQTKSYFTDHCKIFGCNLTVAIQLCVILLVKQAINNFKNGFIPFLYYLSKRKKRSENSLNTREDQDMVLESQPYLPLLDEYLGAVLQFGFVVMFGIVFPLAPLFALMNNVVEIRIYARKYVCDVKRPVPKKAANIGHWLEILNFLTKFSILTNALIISFTTKIIDVMVYDAIYKGQYSTFIDFSMTKFNTNDWSDIKLRWWNETDHDSVKVETCVFSNYYQRQITTDEKQYVKSDIYWVVLAAKLAFIPLFQNVIMCLEAILGYILPPQPKDVTQHVSRNRFIEKQMACSTKDEHRSVLTYQNGNDSTALDMNTMTNGPYRRKFCGKILRSTQTQTTSF